MDINHERVGEFANVFEVAFCPYLLGACYLRFPHCYCHSQHECEENGTGGRNTGLAYEILQSGFQLDIPRMFAALFLITLAGVGLFAMMVGLSRLALGAWHESEVGTEA